MPDIKVSIIIYFNGYIYSVSIVDSLGAAFIGLFIFFVLGLSYIGLII